VIARALAILVLLAGVARADHEILRGAVVKIEARELYIDLGSSRGVVVGAQLRIKRAITLVHPVTRAKIDDWIPIGSALVTQAGEVLSRAVVGELADSVKVGDIAEVLVERTPAVVARAPKPTATVDADTADVLGVFAAQVGQPIEVRIAAWERYLSARPRSPYADAVRRDLETLGALRDQMHPRPAAARAELRVAVAHDAPQVAAIAAPIPVVFVLRDPERVASAYLHFRTAGAPTFAAVLLARDHDRYLRGAVPAEVVQPPGVEYFVEVSAPDGTTGLAIGAPAQPVAVAVAAAPVVDKFGSTPGRSTARLAFDYMDFATFDRRGGDRTDTLVHATADFTYRMASFVESLGVGYGVYAGTGGSANQVWTAAMPAPSSGFH
jgi:hypothetical protein